MEVAYFSGEEIKGLQTRLIAMLNIARRAAGVPFVITSGFRDPSRNLDVGGVRDSAHEKGLAVDIRLGEGDVPLRIVYGLGRAGFKRIGLYDKHIHVDCDDSKPQDVIWSGISH